jgi:hypothetical protein
MSRHTDMRGALGLLRAWIAALSYRPERRYMRGGRGA